MKYGLKIEKNKKAFTFSRHGTLRRDGKVKTIRNLWFSVQFAQKRIKFLFFQVNFPFLRMVM